MFAFPSIHYLAKPRIFRGFNGSEHRTGLTWEPLGLPSQPARFGSKWRREDPEALFNNLVTSLLSRWKTLGLYNIYIEWASALVPPTPFKGGGTGSTRG
jgi:hypothetical protein